MSCHEIGHGMNNVVEKVLELYDDEKISKSAAVELIRTARKSVWYCDGNEYEAVECMEDSRCCRCLKKINDGEELYDLYDISDGNREIMKIPDKPEYGVAAHYLCKECLDNVLKQYNITKK